GYEDFIKHGVPKGRMVKARNYSLLAIRLYSTITNGSPNSTGWPSSTRICVTVPARVEGIWFIVFIASMIKSVCPTATLLPTSMNGLAPGSEAQYAVPTIGECTAPGCLGKWVGPAGGG